MLHTPVHEVPAGQVFAAAVYSVPTIVHENVPQVAACVRRAGTTLRNVIPARMSGFLMFFIQCLVCVNFDCNAISPEFLCKIARGKLPLPSRFRKSKYGQQG